MRQVRDLGVELDDVRAISEGLEIRGPGPVIDWRQNISIMIGPCG